MEEDEEEEEGAGDDYRLGDWCRAEWTEDGLVYEAEVLSVDRRQRTAEVKFVGFGNKEVKNLDDLFMSKGEERRMEQELLSKEADVDLQQVRNKFSLSTLTMNISVLFQDLKVE